MLDLDRHFRIIFDGRFIDVDVASTIADALDAETRERLAKGSADLDTLMKLMPPRSVTFRGFTVFRATDVTDREVISSLKRDLIDKESIVSGPRFDVLQAQLRTLFRRPELRLGLAALDGRRVLSLNHGRRWSGGSRSG